MRREDLPACEAIGKLVHVAHPETEGRMAEKFGLFPAGCRVRREAGRILGYALAHPWRSGAVVALDATLGRLPGDADTLYLHDLALLPEARGQGAGRTLADAVAALAARMDYRTVSFVAVGGTRPFWERAAFRDATTPGIARALRSYDRDATYMQRVVTGLRQP